MELWSHEPGTGPLPDCDKSHTTSLKIISTLFLRIPLSCLGVLFPSIFLTDILHALLLSPTRAIHLVHLKFPYLIIESDLANDTNYNVPHNAVLSTQLSSSVLIPNIFFSILLLFPKPQVKTHTHAHTKAVKLNLNLN